jgi:hypothetical protein
MVEQAFYLFVLLCYLPMPRTLTKTSSLPPPLDGQRFVATTPPSPR